MELIRGLHNLRSRHRGCVATIGAFDGVHRGHQAVLRQLQARGRELGLPTAVVLFEPLPREFFAPEQAPPRLMNFREKVQALRTLGIDRVLRIRFDAAISKMAAEQFAEVVFIDGLGARCVVMGDDQHFGRNREGDIALLRSLGEQVGFSVEAAATVTFAGERISSTRLRAALQQADFALVEQLLGQPFRMTGRVMQGQQLGRRLGVPTANLQLYRRRAPLHGVYTVEVEGVGPLRRPGVANVGTRPTIGDLTRAILEVHLLDFDGDLYGRTISVIFRSRLRDERRFESLDELARQIRLDVDEGRRFFEAAASAQPI